MIEAQVPMPDFGDMLQKANALRAAGSFAEAACAYRAAAAIADQNRDALLFHAICLKDAGREEQAIAAYEELLQAHPSYATGWSLYGTYLKNIGRLDEAIRALRTSLGLSSDIDTRNALVTALYRANREQEARIEGMKNLYEKDLDARRRFDQSPSPSRLDLSRAVRPFDPKARTRNIIAFSLWGDDPVYVHGAIENARLAAHLYYGWTARFYHDDSVPGDALKELQQAGAQTIRIADPALRAIRPMWRFLASDDPGVDRFVCRDADSRLNGQELIAVEEWLKSARPFHIMRDHIYHMELILAGMWGGIAGVLPNLQTQLLASPQYYNNRFADQLYLRYEVWPLIRDHCLTHDTHYHYHGGIDFPSAYRLPPPIHVGGAIKQMRHWRSAPVSPPGQADDMPSIFEHP